jgi:hypothetical protein
MPPCGCRDAAFHRCPRVPSFIISQPSCAPRPCLLAPRFNQHPRTHTTRARSLPHIARTKKTTQRHATRPGSRRPCTHAHTHMIAFASFGVRAQPHSAFEDGDADVEMEGGARRLAVPGEHITSAQAFMRCGEQKGTEREARRADVCAGATGRMWIGTRSSRASRAPSSASTSSSRCARCARGAYFRALAAQRMCDVGVSLRYSPEVGDLVVGRITEARPRPLLVFPAS